jgi:hypothetical protein
MHLNKQQSLLVYLYVCVFSACLLACSFASIYGVSQYCKN